jgi:5-methylcytosine-specific restriction endonuclease McrA
MSSLEEQQNIIQKLIKNLCDSKIQFYHIKLNEEKYFFAMYLSQIEFFLKPTYPTVQRDRMNSRVLSFKKILNDNYKKYGTNQKFITDLNTIHFGIENTGQFVNLDGQHRFEALRSFANDKDIDPFIQLNIYLTNGTPEELEQIFKDLNNNLVTETALFDDSLSTEEARKHKIMNYLKEHYIKFKSESDLPRMPNIKFGLCVDYFLAMCPSNSSKTIIEEIEKVNQEEYKKYRIKDIKFIDSVHKKDSVNPLYLGKLIYAHQKEINEKNGTNTKRQKIPEAVKKHMWLRDFEKMNAEGICHVCKGTLIYTDCHAGHIISCKNGGTNHVSNLIALCPKCNTSMGEKNLDDFMEEYINHRNQEMNVETDQYIEDETETDPFSFIKIPNKKNKL